LSQAEHGYDSQVVLVSTDEATIDKVKLAIEEQLKDLPRKEMASKAIENSKFVLVKDQVTALELIDFYGPEHFIISTKDDDYFVENINNAGSVFIGKYTPESAGDYASGTNHTLPTNGYAKQYSGVNLDSFNKAITYQKITEEGIKHIGEAVELMAEAEGLQAHKNAMTLRRNEVENKSE
jgi:histidinol dehydrogenase